jgi:hypothetical protein
MIPKWSFDVCGVLVCVAADPTLALALALALGPLKLGDAIYNNQATRTH